jgi:ribonucleotide reductase beta subunit family protein with ferritin-like domain
MSVINTNSNIDFTKEPQFFGETLGIQRYDQYKYPALHQLYKTQKNYYWSPSEISLQKDRGDYSTLTANEKFIYTSNLKYQILLDSIQSRSTSLAFLPFVSLPELEKNIIVWSFFETIHSESYTHIIENVYSEPSTVFDHILNDVEIIKRSNSVTKYYDEFIKLSSAYYNNDIVKELVNDNNLTARSLLLDLKRSLYLSMVNVNILEGIRFYTSFACSFAFAENSKMIGSADIISLIARDEACYTPAHECLTQSGWKYIKNVTLDDKVLQFNSNNTVEFVNPTDIITKKYQDELYHFYDDHDTFEQIVTKDHRMIWRDLTNGRLRESTAENTAFTTSYKAVILSGLLLEGEIEISPIEILNIFFEYCGRVMAVSGDNLDLQMTLKNVDWWRILGAALTKLGISYDYKVNYKTSVYTVTLTVPTITLKKYFGWVDIKGKSTIWAQNVIKLCRILSNNINYTTHTEPKFKFYVNNAASLLKIQELFAISYWKIRASKHYKINHGHTITVDTSRNHVKTNNIQIKKIQYSGLVHCLTVPSGAFLVRHNGKVSVGGNCHRRLSETVIKNWQNGDDPDFTDIIKEEELTVYDMFRTAVDEEIAWANHLFKDGSVLGLNAEILTQYIKFTANQRLKSLNLKPLFPDISKKNPIPWIDNYLKSSNISVAPMETEIISYMIGNVVRDVAENQFANFEL